MTMRSIRFFNNLLILVWQFRKFAPENCHLTMTCDLKHSLSICSTLPHSQSSCKSTNFPSFKNLFARIYLCIYVSNYTSAFNQAYHRLYLQYLGISKGYIYCIQVYLQPRVSRHHVQAEPPACSCSGPRRGKQSFYGVISQ